MEQGDVAKQRAMRLFEANFHLQAGDSKRALEMCQELEKEDPEKPFNYIVQATSYIQLKDYRKALFYVNKAESMYRAAGKDDPELANRINRLRAYAEALVKREGCDNEG